MSRFEILYLVLFVNTVMTSYIFYRVLRKSISKPKKKHNKKMARSFNEITKVNADKIDIDEETKIEKWRRQR